MVGQKCTAARSFVFVATSSAPPALSFFVAASSVSRANSVSHASSVSPPALSRRQLFIVPVLCRGRGQFFVEDEVSSFAPTPSPSCPVFLCRRPK